MDEMIVGNCSDLAARINRVHLVNYHEIMTEIIDSTSSPEDKLMTILGFLLKVMADTIEIQETLLPY